MPSNPETKEELAEAFWQEVEKAFFADVPQLLVEAIEQHLLHASDFLQEFENAVIGSNTIHPTSDQGACATNSNVIYEKGFPRFNRGGSLLLRKANSKAQTFLGPWEFLAAQRSLLNFLQNGNDDGHLKVAAVHEEGKTDASGTHYGNLDTFVSTLLGLPLADALSVDAREKIQLYGRCTHQKRPNSSADKGTRRAVSVSDELQQKISTVVAAAEENDSKQTAFETSACNWDRDVCYLVKALGFGNCIYNDPFEAINFLENVYNQAQIELQSQKSNEFTPCILPQGYPQGVRFVFSFPPSGFLLSRYSSSFTKQITMTREWTQFLQTIFDYHVKGFKTCIKNGFSPKSTADQKTLELENDDGGKVSVSERVTSEAMFGLGYAVIGPQPLWRVSFLPQNRCTDNASTSNVEQLLAGSSKVSVVQSKTAFASSRLISWPLWSQTATGVARECAIIDGVEVPRDAYLPFSSGTAFQAALTANVFNREKRKRFLSSKNNEVCYGNGDHEALALPKLAESSKKKRLAEYCSIDVKNVGQTDSSPCKNSELEVERLYLLRQLRCTVGAKYRLLQRLQEKIRAYVPPAKDYWRKVEESMVDLYRFEMFSSSSSGRFTYNLYRQYRDFDFLRMLCSLKGLTLPGWWNEQGLCSVCGSGIAYDDDPIVFCDGCFVPAHHGCVGYPTISVSPESIPTFPVPPGDLDEFCEPVFCGNEDSGFISKGLPVARRAVLQSVREQTAIRRATTYGQRRSPSPSMAPTTEAQEAHKKKSENVGVGVKRDGNLFPKRSLLKSGKESTFVKAETPHLTYKEREVVDNSPSSPMSVTNGRKGKRSNAGKCAEYKLGCRAGSSRTKVADYFAAKDHHTGTVNPINQQPEQSGQETQTLEEVKTYQPCTSINSVDEEWYCDCCHLIMHQLNDVPTALAVIRHLAGPRTPKEFDDALAHERSSELPETFDWYLPSLLDEDYQPQSLFKSDEGTSLTFGSELSETATQAANASVASGDSGRKQLEKSSAAAQSTTSESPTPSPVRDARPYRVRRSRYRLKKNKTRVKRYLRRGGGRADELYVKTPERSNGVKQIMQENSRMKSLTREVEADNIQAGITSTTSGLTVCAALQEKPLFNCVNKKRKTTSKNNSSVLTQKQPNVALLSSVREPEQVVWRFSKSKFFSTLHTESPTYWYCWHVVVSVDEIETARKSLQRQGSVNMDKRCSRNSSLPIKKSTEEEDCAGSLAKENELGCEKKPGFESFDVSGRHWRLKENISAAEVCETPPSTVPSQQKNESRYREFIVYIPCCALCGYDAYFKGGGVIKKALSNLKQREFAHVRCATAVNGVLEPEAVRYTVEPGRAELRCTYCRQRGPAPVQCQHSQCARAYHVSCASQAQDCVTEFVEVRPHIYCSIHSRKKPPTQALRTYHQSLEKRRRIDRRLEEEALSTWLPSPFVSSNWLRSLFSTYSLSFNSLDALFPSPLTPLMAVNGRCCGLISSGDRSLARHKGDGACATVAQEPIGSAESKKMCCVARKDSLAKQQVAAEACSKEHVFFIDAFNSARRFSPFYVLDETTWIVSGLAAGRCVTQLAFFEHGKAHQRAITAAELSLLAERSKQRGTMLQQPNGRSVKACFRPDLKHLLSPSYRLYLHFMGANSAESLIDTGMRLFLFLTGEIPTQALTEDILATALTVARGWEKNTVPWMLDTQTSPLKDVTYSSPQKRGRTVVSALNLTKLSQISVEPVVNVSKRWMCCCCGRDIKLLHKPKLLSSTKSGSATPKDRNLGATGFRCVVCGCVVCISCLQTYNNSYVQRDSTSSATGEPCCAESAHDLEVSAVENEEHLFSTQHEVLSSSTAVSAQLQNCEPNSENSAMSCTMETRKDSALVRDDSNDSSTPLTHKNRRGFLTAARFTPRRKLRYAMESEKSTYNVSSNVEENLTNFFCQLKDHPLLCARCHWCSQKKRCPLPLESCVLCNRNDGYLVPQNYGTFDREKRTSPVSGFGKETFGMVTTPARHRAEDKKQRLSNVEPDTCWVHPCCIEWFAPSKLKSQGFACVARTLKKYGCRFNSRNDESLLTSCASSFSPPSTVCDICNVAFGALWRCSDPRCSKAFHVSCARLWNCKFDEGHRKSVASETGLPEVVAARRAYCLEHSAQTSMNATTPTRKQAVYFSIKRIGVAMSSWSRFLDAKLADRQAWDIEKGATTVITRTAVASFIQAFLSGLGCLFLLFPCGAPTVHQRWVVERESLGAFLDQSCRLPSHSYLPRVATEESKLAASLLGKAEQDCFNLVTSCVKSCDNSSTPTEQWTPVQNLIVDSTLKAQILLFTELAEAERHLKDGLATEQWTTYLTKEDGAADGLDVFSSEDESVVVDYGNDLQNSNILTASKVDVDAWILENRRRVLSVLRPTHRISLGIAQRLWASAGSALKDALRRGKDGAESFDQRSRGAKRPFPDAYGAQSTLPCRRRRASSHRATRKHIEDLEAREPFSMEPLASPLHNSGRQKLRIPASGVPRRRGRPRKYLLFQAPSSPKVDATAEESKAVEDVPAGSTEQSELTQAAVASPAANKQQQQPEEFSLSKTGSLHSVVDAEQNRVERIMKDAATEPSEEKVVQMSSQQQTEMHMQQLQQHYHLQFQQFQQQQHPLLLGRLLPQFLAPDQIASTNGFFYDPRYMYPPMPSADIRCQRPFSAWDQSLSGKSVNSCAPQPSPSPSYSVPTVGGVSVAYPFFMTSPERFAPAFATPVHHGVQPSQQVWCPNTQGGDVAKQHIEQQAPSLPTDALPAFAIPSQHVPCYATQPQLYHPYQLQYMRQQQHHATHQLLMSTFGESSMRLQPRGSHSTPMGASYYAGRLVDTAAGLVASPSFQPQSRGPPASSIPTLSPSSSAHIFQTPQ